LLFLFYDYLLIIIALNFLGRCLVIWEGFGGRGLSWLMGLGKGGSIGLRLEWMWEFGEGLIILIRLWDYKFCEEELKGCYSEKVEDVEEESI
jgi:hypothetical protein